jgi:hypothetical protein
MRGVKRAVCILIGHRYIRIRYPESPDGYFLRCNRCWNEREEPGGGAEFMGGALGQ